MLFSRHVIVYIFLSELRGRAPRWDAVSSVFALRKDRKNSRLVSLLAKTESFSVKKEHQQPQREHFDSQKHKAKYEFRINIDYATAIQ